MSEAGLEEERATTFPAAVQALLAIPPDDPSHAERALALADRLCPGEAAALLRLAAERARAALERETLARERDRALADAALAVEEVASRRRAVDFILGVVGHDLRNPLGAIHMSAALLQKRGALEGWPARTVDRIRSSANRMNRIIADLLSYTRTRLGSGIPIVRRPTRLEELARRVVDELRAALPDRSITVDAPDPVPGEWDPDRLEQVLSNLVANALDHGEPDAPVRLEPRAEPGGAVVRVRNAGPPVPAEVLTRLFEPFARPPEGQGRKGSGLGLGLYISREIVRGHGGTIALEHSGEGTGNETTVTVRLPAS